MWLSDLTGFSPLRSYAICFLLLGLWALVEIFSSIKIYRSTSNVIISGISMLSVIFVLIGLYHFFQFNLIQQGRLEPEDYLIKFVDFNRLKPLQVDTLFPSWSDFLYEQRCGNGLSLSRISEPEMKTLDEKYQMLLQVKSSSRQAQ